MTGKVESRVRVASLIAQVATLMLVVGVVFAAGGKTKQVDINSLNITSLTEATTQLAITVSGLASADVAEQQAIQRELDAIQQRLLRLEN